MSHSFCELMLGWNPCPLKLVAMASRWTSCRHDWVLGICVCPGVHRWHNRMLYLGNLHLASGHSQSPLSGIPHSPFVYFSSLAPVFPSTGPLHFVQVFKNSMALDGVVSVLPAFPLRLQVRFIALYLVQLG